MSKIKLFSGMDFSGKTTILMLLMKNCRINLILKRNF